MIAAVANRGALAFAVLVASAPLAASAQPAAESQKLLAARLLDEGVARFDAGDYASALEKFQAAYEAYPSPKIFLNLGEALRRLHRDPAAADAYDRFLTETATAPEVSDAKKRVAQSALEELRGRLGRLRIDSDLTAS